MIQKRKRMSQFDEIVYITRMVDASKSDFLNKIKTLVI